ncbi:MAG: GTPase HflX [bacterium]|nr:GTPase HflX [bacterium]
MKKIIDLNKEKIKEIVVTVGMQYGESDKWHVRDSLSELNQLVYTAGGTVIKEFTTARSSPTPAYFIGKGKLEEVRAFCEGAGVTTVIFDDDLSPAQKKNLTEELKAKVLDRTELILDIFALHAVSAEGKLQIEKAQLEYMLPRLTRAWTHLSRQEGGIGTRGPGERQLEIDRRRVKERIYYLNSKIAELRQARGLRRKKRQSVPVTVISIIGYTNAGKSTLLNSLTGAGVLVEDKLFATLDTTTRMYFLPSGQKVLLTDTVGFLNKLPHGLIESFKATLEEVTESDMLIYVIDASREDAFEQDKAVKEVLKELKADGKPIIKVFNKCDIEASGGVIAGLKRHYPDGIEISALEKKGFEELNGKIQAEMDKILTTYKYRIPVKEYHLVNKFYEMGNVKKVEYKDDEIIIMAETPARLSAEMKKYRKQDKVEVKWKIS